MVLEMRDPDEGNREFYVSAPSGRLAGPYTSASAALDDMKYFRVRRRFPGRLKLVAMPRGSQLMSNGEQNLFWEVDKTCK